MATLFNTKISATYPGLIKTTDNAAITATLKQLTDGTGNNSGLYVNNAGDFKVTAILEWGSLKDTGTGVTITQWVTAANGIENFNNDTTVPTSAAVKTYVDAVVTASDLDFLGDTNTGTPAVDLDSQNFSVLGTTNEIVTSGAAQTLTIGLPNSVVISGTFTGTTFAGDLNGTINTATTATTQSAGDNSTKVATTAYVDSLDAASDLDFSGDSGTGDVTLNTQVLAITGTTNQIITTAANQGLSLSLPATVHRDLQGNVTGNVDGDLTGNVTSTSVLADGVTATTQASSDSSTKVATTAYVKGLDNASDLDITGDTGTGDVNLNTQTLNILGTTNEITTAVVNQTATISLPSSISVDVIGNVTGNLTGNADTATTWETARDLSLTGQATATLSNVDGALAVSGAVTLDNNSVTAKVLTGLPTPAAATVLATDSIVNAFGKLQSQINGIANGLQFQGTWDVPQNNPALASGGGEADSGTTTATTANKLIDTTAGQNFLTTVSVGDKVINRVDGQTALVTNVDSDTSLSLDADIMLINEAYTIDKSPFIEQGYYYVVSVGGARTLNGITNWAVGDWVIAGATNVWEKLDHTDVEGTGTGTSTTGNLARWSGPGTIVDSNIAQDVTAVTVTGSLSTTTFLSSTGNFSVNTDKFTTNATTGNTAFTGDLAINTNKFTVNATSGDTTIAGNVSLPDNSKAIFGANDNLQTYSDGTDSYVDNTGGELKIRTNELRLLNYGTSKYITADSGADVSLYYNNVKKFETTSTGVSVTGNGTFGGHIQAENRLTLTDAAAGATRYVITDETNTGTGILVLQAGGGSAAYGGALGMYANAHASKAGDVYAGISSGSGGSFRVNTSGTDNGTDLLTINQATGATFAGNVSLTSGALSITADGSNAVTFTESGNGLLTIATPDDIILDAAGDIVIDAGADDIRFKNNGTEVGVINLASSNFTITSAVSDKDIIFGGNDGGTGITALTLDMSEGGKATFAGNVLINKASNPTSLQIGSNLTDDPFIVFQTDGNTMSMGIDRGDSNKFKISDNATLGTNDRFIIDSSGNVGINNTNPSAFNVLGGLQTVIGNGSGNANLTLYGASTDYSHVAFADSNASGSSAQYAGLLQYYHADNSLKIYTNGIERIKINDAGNVFISTPITNAFYGLSLTYNSANTADFTVNQATGQIKIGGVAAGYFPTFYAGGSERMRITSGGDTQLSGNNLDIKGTSSGNTSVRITDITGTVGTNSFDLINDGTAAYLYNRANTSMIFGTNNTERVRILENGRFQFSGISSTQEAVIQTNETSTGTGALRLQAGAFSAAYGGGIVMYANAHATKAGDVAIGLSATTGSEFRVNLAGQDTSTDALVCNRAGNLTITGTLYENSDITLKENIKPLESQLEIVNKLNPVSYNKKEDKKTLDPFTGKKEIGFIAQEVEEILPELISENKEGIKSLAYARMNAVLVKAIQELKAEVDKLKQECKCKN